MTTQIPANLSALLARPEAERTLGQYHLLHQLGSGGFAPVWLAAERYGRKELRKVAVKLFALGAEDAAREEAIVEEAQSLCTVEHPNVVRFYTFTRDASLGVLGLVMEYVRGGALDRRLVEREKLPLSEVVEIGLSVAAALEAVHAVGLIHRDLKPGNVIVSEGVYKLIDFGIASAERKAPAAKPEKKRVVVLDDLPIAAATTKASMLAPSTLGGVAVDGGEHPFANLAGTLGYIDPKTLSAGTPATPASDLYALGATLFECTTGLVPAAFAAKYAGAFGLKGDVLDGRASAPSLALAAPDAPASLVALVDALLDPEPERRPASASEVRAALRALQAHDAQLVPAASAAAPTVAPPTMESPTVASEPAPSEPAATVRRGTPAALKFGAIGLVVAVAAAGAFAKVGGSPAVAPSAEPANVAAASASVAPSTSATAPPPAIDASVPDDAGGDAAVPVRPARSATPLRAAAPSATAKPSAAAPTAAPTAEHGTGTGGVISASPY